jgi:hypothetical protein
MAGKDVAHPFIWNCLPVYYLFIVSILLFMTAHLF